MKASGTTIRVLVACAGVLVLFGLVAALLIDTEDDGEAAGGQAETTTTTVDESTTTTERDEGGDASSSTTTSETSVTTSTSTTRSPTTTTRPGATTTALGATTTSVPATTTTIPIDERVADLTLSRTTVAPSVLRYSVQNSGPHAAPALELVVTVGAGMTITSAVGREGMTCGAPQGTEVRCSVAEAPVGGRVGGAEVQVSGTGEVRGSVHSAADDPKPDDNTVVTVV